MKETPHLGWIPDPTRDNVRDWVFPATGSLAVSVDTDLRHLSPPIMDQGVDGSCVWQAIAGLIYAEHRRQGFVGPLLSRRRGWYQSRKEQGLEDYNVGCWLRQGFGLLNATGFCSERYFPHKPGAHTEAPPIIADQMAVDQAAKYAVRSGRKPVEYRRLIAAKGQARVALFREALGNGHQIAFGIDVDESFVDNHFDPRRPYNLDTSPLVGGHAMRIVASTSEGFIVANSWGEHWGDDGHFVMGHSWAGQARDPWVVISAPYFSAF